MATEPTCQCWTFDPEHPCYGYYLNLTDPPDDCDEEWNESATECPVCGAPAHGEPNNNSD